MLRRALATAVLVAVWPAVLVLRVLDDMVLTYDWEDEAE